MTHTSEGTYHKYSHVYGSHSLSTCVVFTSGPKKWTHWNLDAPHGDTVEAVVCTPVTVTRPLFCLLHDSEKDTSSMAISL